MTGNGGKPPDVNIDLYISEHAFKKMLRHCDRYSAEDLEVMGFLIGDKYKWKGTEYTIVKDIVSTELDASPVSVRFQRDAFSKLFSRLDKIAYDFILVGWYHSHPGHSAFMSSTDTATQKRMFNKPYHSAIIIDPLNKEMKAFTLRGRKCVEKPYAIYQGEFDDGGVSVGVEVEWEDEEKVKEKGKGKKKEEDTRGIIEKFKSVLIEPLEFFSIEPGEEGTGVEIIEELEPVPEVKDTKPEPTEGKAAKETRPPPAKPKPPLIKVTPRKLPPPPVGPPVTDWAEVPTQAPPAEEKAPQAKVKPEPYKPPVELKRAELERGVPFMDRMPRVFDVPIIWFLLPVLLGVFGGAVGYMGVRKRRKGVALMLLALGVVMGIIWFIGSYLSA